jgi:hypothetical protein
LRNAIRADLRALGERLDEQTDACVVWLAYPIPSDRKGHWRANDLRLINLDAARTKRIACINVGAWSVHVYLSEARAPVSVASAGPATSRIQLQ